MAEVVRNTSQLSDEDRAAIAAYQRILELDGDPGLRQRVSALLQELRRGLN